jgi:hypothetical protein
MTSSPENPQPDIGFDALEEAQLRLWMQLDTATKVDFFEEMVAIAYQAGALTVERLALRDESGALPASGPRREG